MHPQSSDFWLVNYAASSKVVFDKAFNPLGIKIEKEKAQRS